METSVLLPYGSPLIPAKNELRVAAKTTAQPEPIVERFTPGNGKAETPLLLPAPTKIILFVGNEEAIPAVFAAKFFRKMFFEFDFRNKTRRVETCFASTSYMSEINRLAVNWSAMYADAPDLLGRRVPVITREMLGEASTIYALDRMTRDQLIRAFPEFRSQIRTIKGHLILGAAETQENPAIKLTRHPDDMTDDQLKELEPTLPPNIREIQHDITFLDDVRKAMPALVRGLPIQR